MILSFSYFHLLLFVFFLLMHIFIISKADLHFWINKIDYLMNFVLGISLANFFWLLFISMILLIDSTFGKRDPSEYSVLSIFYLILLFIPISIFIGLKKIGNLRRMIKQIFLNSDANINSFEFSILLSHITVPFFFLFIIEDIIAFSLIFLFMGWIISTIVGLTIEILRILIKKLVLDNFI